MKNLVLIGGGGHCKSCIDTIELTKQYNIIGILDLEEKIGESVLDYKIIGTDNDIENFVKQGYLFLITLGQIKSNQARVNLYNKIKSLNGKLETIISPLAYVSKHAKIGDGSIVLSNALVNADAKIGNNCIINSKALIEHDAKIGNHCHISTGAIINGGTIINDNSFVGSNAIVIQYTEVPKESFIKANSLFQ